MKHTIFSLVSAFVSHCTIHLGLISRFGRWNSWRQHGRQIRRKASNRKHGNLSIGSCYGSTLAVMGRAGEADSPPTRGTMSRSTRSAQHSILIILIIEHDMDWQFESCS